MHRVELKDSCLFYLFIELHAFLMHRVELKELAEFLKAQTPVLVPNAPCGVERKLSRMGTLGSSLVPNAPCGVERVFLLTAIARATAFLMHRVELKASLWLLSKHSFSTFLMHRVELKATIENAVLILTLRS